MARKTTPQERREFLVRAMQLAGGCVYLGLLAGCETDVIKSSNITVRFDISEEPALGQVGGAAKRSFEGQNGGAPVLIIRLDEDDFLVLSTICTHLGCEVNLPGDGDPNIWCACHDSFFNKTSGAVLSGPATAPLPRFESAFDKSTKILTITF